MRLTALALIFFAVNAQAELTNKDKVGIGAWETDGRGTMSNNVESLHFRWYYDWRSDPMYSPPSDSVSFVPMIWDENHVNDSIPANPSALLGFNEPDIASQANMSVGQAISLWPYLMSRQVRLGSPAPSTDQALGSQSWLGQFMAKANSLGYRVDFIAVHYYSANPDVAAFKTFLENVHAAYQKPIWVTEWGLVDWNNPGRFSYEDTAAFAKNALVVLDGLSYVERHAWFSAGEYQYGGTGIHTELFDSNNNLTPVGVVFAEAMGVAPVVDPPSQDTTAPTTALTYPVDGGIVSRNKKVTLAAEASDNVGVKQVLFFVNGKKVCSDPSTPYTCAWTSPKRATTVKIQTKAYDAAGNVGVSPLVSLKVQ